MQFQTLTAPEFQSLVRNGALQFASDYGLSIALPPPAISVPQQFTVQVPTFYNVTKEKTLNHCFFMRGTVNEIN